MSGGTLTVMRNREDALRRLEGGGRREEGTRMRGVLGEVMRRREERAKVEREERGEVDEWFSDGFVCSLGR